MKLHSLAVAILCLGTALTSQSLDGEVLAAGYPSGNVGGGLFVVDPAKATMTPLTGVSGDLVWSYSVAHDPWASSVSYVGTTGADQPSATNPSIYRILATAGKLISSQKLNTVALTGDQRILDIAVVGSELFFLTNTRFARMPITGGAPTTIAKALYKWPVMCSDGRYLYCNFDAQGFGKDSLYQIDPQDTTHWKQIFSLPPINLSDIFSLELAADGQILVLDKGNFSGPDLNFVDPATGKSTKKMTFFPPHFRAWKAVEDGKTRNIIVIGSGTEDQVSVWSSTGSVVQKPFGTKTGSLRDLAVRRVPWLHRSGFACKASSTQMSLFGNSVPELGNTGYALSLSALPNSPGILLLGIRGQLPKPLSLSGLGMGNCELGVLPLATFAIAVPASGSVAIPLPIAKNLPRSDIDVQVVLGDRNANNTGLITSQVGSIIIR